VVRRNPAEILTGAVVLMVAGGFLSYALSNSGRRPTAGYMLHAAFDHVDGLVVGADVRIAGVKVGSVVGEHIDPKSFLARVDFTVQKGVQLSTDSSATVTSDGLLGGKYLSLAPGGEAEVLRPGGEITITQGSVSLEQLLGKFIFNLSSSKSGSQGTGAAAPAPEAGQKPAAGRGSGNPVPPLQ
jgi:phospholipid/cholesterol/gamma-HCH transport system substrate-binding protein